MADDADLAWTHEKPWKNILHYRPGHFGHESSTIDSGDFFFAKDGRTNPEAEAIAFIKALKANLIVGKLKQTVFCSFPERTRFVLENTKVFLSDEVLSQKCELHDRYLKQFNDPERISLVFSSAYPNNPASMFGHTFLKVHSKRQTDLLDGGLNYAAAVADNENPFAFFWFGVTGGYEGHWSIQPYYVKVQDYVNFESRDLWEYEINFTTSEVKRFLNHIWEIENNSGSDYFFFDENCSFQILASLEAIRPDWNLLNYTIYVIPGESVKFLTRQPLSVREVRYRPSLFKKAMASYDGLSVNEKNQYDEVLSLKAAGRLKELSVLALDTMLIEMDFKRNQDKKFEENWIPFEKSLRTERATRGLSAKTPVTEQAGSESRITRPDLGHDSYSIQPSLGFRSHRNVDQDQREERTYLGFKLKSAYHDLLSSDKGYSQFSEIDFPWIEVSLDSKNKFRVDQIGGLQSISLSPVSHFKTPISFKTKITIDHYDYFNRDFYYLNGELGFGLTTHLGFPDQRLYLLAVTNIEAAREFEKGYRLLPGLEAGYLMDFSNRYKVQGLVKLNCNINQARSCEMQSEYQLNQSIFFARNHEVRNTNSYRQLFFESQIQEQKYQLSYLYFFN